MALFFDWVTPLTSCAGLFVMYALIYSSLAWVFGWPKLSRHDGKELGIALAMLACVGVPVILILEKFKPDLAPWKVSLFIIVLMTALRKFFRRRPRPETD